ncbi:hypothetical protein MNBD_GAMMA24-1067 [hydrothermal vent metagenome]|uniref:ABC transporter domain-containing protein n=1 Tax=hydrothermal vent metagenome TaxID=652676 RepID=A0A3B1BLG7_9ZZZZ
MPLPTPNVIEARNLTVKYGSNIILDDVSFNIAPGTFTGLIGPNGAGKTTLIKTILGLIKPSKGSITVLGHPAGKSVNLTAYVPQTSTTEQKMPVTVEEVVMMGRIAKIGIGKRASDEDRTAVGRAMEIVGVSSLAKKYFNDNSGGERQKVLIARAIAGSPRLLLLDEPTTGVDTLGEESFYEMLDKFRNELKMTILMVSHDIGVIHGKVDNIICLNRKLFCHNTPDRALEDGVLENAYGADMELFMHNHEIPHRTVKPHRDK